MPIKLANEISWQPPPRCPTCNVGIAPTGRSMPVAIDQDGRVYCRDHGVTVEPTYPNELASYMAWRDRRAKAIDALEQDVAPSKRAAG